MARYSALTIIAVGPVAGGVNIANDALAQQVGVLIPNLIAVDRFNYTYKFMPQDALEAHVTTHNL